MTQKRTFTLRGGVGTVTIDVDAIKSIENNYGNVSLNLKKGDLSAGYVYVDLTPNETAFMYRLLAEQIEKQEALARKSEEAIV